MKKILVISLIILVLFFLLSCASHSNRAGMHFYHGPTVPDLFISVISHTPEVIVFEIRAKFVQKHLYHLILDGDDPLSEGWFPTARVQTDSYTVKMKAKKGCLFQPGKTYRLCIGRESPDLVYVHSSNYPCFVDYEFVLN